MILSLFPLLLPLLPLLLPILFIASCSKGAMVPKKSSTSSNSSIGKSRMNSTCSRTASTCSGKDAHGNFLTLLLQKTAKDIAREFKAHLFSYSVPGLRADVSAANADLNRYSDVLCLDKNRVKLEWDRKSDYIHASRIETPGGQNYIATQGPLPSSQEAFWQMIYQERCPAIVQTCRFVEGDNEEKCAAYWPLEGQETTIGAFTITVLERMTAGDVQKIARGLAETKWTILEVKKAGCPKKLRVEHFYVQDWPDKSAPREPEGIVNLARYLHTGIRANLDRSERKNPVCIHCSAGVGRTATLLGIVYADEYLKKWKGSRPPDNLVEVVKGLRAQRFKAVQTPVQYVFIHVALLEMAAQDNLIPRDERFHNFMDSFSKLIEKGVIRTQTSHDE